MSFEDMSRIYNSLVALVKADYTFDKALQDRAAEFLKNISQESRKMEETDRLVTDLVPSSATSPSGFAESILTLLSSPHPIVAASVLSFLYQTTRFLSPAVHLRLVESDFISNVLATVQPHTLPIAENEEMVDKLITIIINCFVLASPLPLSEPGITAAIDVFNLREKIFQKVVLPSSQFVTFLISIRHVLKGDLFISFMVLLTTHIEFCPFHRPTMEFVLASPIVVTFSSCLSFIENDRALWNTLNNTIYMLIAWTDGGGEIVISAKRMMQALFSEGFEDTLEQVLMNHDKAKNGIRYIIRDTASRMTPSHFCGLSSDVGNSVIAGADEQILGSLPIVQKCATVFDCHIVNHPLSKQFLVSLHDAL
ncbi:hypothetical protein BLNAU_23318 [Blattamonas nauphoetae]|uniref:Uncharacterized protein n=1 Tax=Blattamonas nauphoetae TaxID=2049346 RepID=A0ABQ9WUR1_9EUKA|nr:hypothetical protein BLNAU_23318 [Blattamonas nauphoetae]